MHGVELVTADYHTGGEPFRIVPDLPLQLRGRTVAERREFAITSPEVAALRDFLALEPRGHRDMFGGFIVPADDSGAHFGSVFWAQDGFATGCGHGTIALGTWAVETGRVASDPSGVTAVVVDVPSGRVTARVHTEGEGVTSVDFLNVPSFGLARDVEVTTSVGNVRAQIAYGGASYAHVEATAIGLSVDPSNARALADIGTEIREAVSRLGAHMHPAHPGLAPLQGTVIFEDLGLNGAGDLVQRNVVVYGDRHIDRSPCGSGTSSRMALLHETGALAVGQRFVHQSIIGSTFTGVIESLTDVNGREAIVPVLNGSAFRVGTCAWEFDPRDPLSSGFRF